MKIVKAGFERITEKDPIKKIEQVARVCYKSEDRICEGSAEKMVRALVKSQHYAMLEHGYIIIQMGVCAYTIILENVDILKEHYGYDTMLRNTLYNRAIISANFRAWLEYMQGCVEYGLKVPPELVTILLSYSPIFDGLNIADVRDAYTDYGYIPFDKLLPEDLTEAERLVHEDLTIKFTCDRGVSHEIVRHRKASFAQESTRYCNYGKSGEVTFIEPNAIFHLENGADAEYVKSLWELAMLDAESKYLHLLENGATPQEARSVLPNSLKTEVVMTANLQGWIHFFRLRALGTTGKPHPQMLEVAVPAMQDVLESHKFLRDYLEV